MVNCLIAFLSMCVGCSGDAKATSSFPQCRRWILLRQPDCTRCHHETVCHQGSPLCFSHLIPQNYDILGEILDKIMYKAFCYLNTYYKHDVIVCQAKANDGQPPSWIEKWEQQQQSLPICISPLLPQNMFFCSFFFAFLHKLWQQHINISQNLILLKTQRFVIP